MSLLVILESGAQRYLLSMSRVVQGLRLQQLQNVQHAKYNVKRTSECRNKESEQQTTLSTLAWAGHSLCKLGRPRTLVQPSKTPAEPLQSPYH